MSTSAAADNRSGYTYPAWCQMETALDCYQQDREAYLIGVTKMLGADGQRELNRLHEAAELLLKGTAELADVDPVTTLRELFEAGVGLQIQHDSLANLLDEHVCIDFAWNAMGMLDSARERFWRLLGVLKPLTPNKKARAFLLRVSRCFLFGFDSECIVMCRAVLDRQFEAEIAADDVRTWWDTTPEGLGGKLPSLNLYSRIQAAVHIGRIDANVGNSAHKVRKEGNDAVHSKPSSADGLDILIATMQTLSGLLG